MSARRKPRREEDGWFSWGSAAACAKGHWAMQTKDTDKGRLVRCLECGGEPTLVPITLACCGTVKGKKHLDHCPTYRTQERISR